VFTDNPVPNQAKYIVSKSGLVGLTRSLAVEFAQHNIQVNMVSASIVETDLSRHVPKIFLEEMKNVTPMKRNATAADVAKAVIFLSSGLASFTTDRKLWLPGEIRHYYKDSAVMEADKIVTLDVKNQKHVQAAARLHQELLSDSPIPQLGEQFMTKFYYTNL